MASERFQHIETKQTSSKNFNTDSRIIVSTYSKSGIGFDYDKLDTLLIATDFKEGVEQYCGRIFRKRDKIPIIIDIVDDFPSLKSHWYFRRKWYISHNNNGEIKDFNEEFKDFNDFNNGDLFYL